MRNNLDRRCSFYAASLDAIVVYPQKAQGCKGFRWSDRLNISEPHFPLTSCICGEFDAIQPDDSSLQFPIDNNFNYSLTSYRFDNPVFNFLRPEYDDNISVSPFLFNRKYH